MKGKRVKSDAQCDMLTQERVAHEMGKVLKSPEAEKRRAR